MATKIIVEVPDDYDDEECDQVEMSVSNWLDSKRSTLVLRGLKATVFEYDSTKGAQVATAPRKE